MSSPPCVHCAAPAPTRAEDVYNFNSFVNWEYDYTPSPEGRIHMQHGLPTSAYPAMQAALANSACEEVDVWSNPFLDFRQTDLSQTPELDITPTTSTNEPRVVSTAFNAQTTPNLDYPADIQLVSTDDVYFYVSTAVLNASSFNRFTEALTGPTIPCRGFPCKRVPERAEVLNVLLHTAYGVSPSAFVPSLTTLTDAIGRLPTYGLNPKAHVAPGGPIFELVRAQAALSPLHVYTVAAMHDLFPLAQMVSPHLLSYPISSMTDAQASGIGAVYLKHLFLLHRRRVDALRDLLAQPPQFHPATDACDYGAQRGLARSWSAAAATVLSEARPDTSVGAIEDAFRGLKASLTCAECRKGLEIRVRRAVVEWTMTSTSI
ncbi:uncharacterized protein SCHCODRAFT_02744080 [Schizophyllum commune H4-8]|uniref:Expressed protein n=1 Tax=Schizophyllum commune (strain H4-8 / FGSC 9210) TaxID=578458 RepID=D8PK52_SCHCM|nr:uncharacterized protein SCHCODRAFT_02744080 [Schizophyllum commune H4-8]KAI5897734.1 hypothetical protein SCHCODRAFT_02744080 [Schizophyllum commune H4-8]